MSSALSKPLLCNSLDLISKPSSSGRPCLVALLRFHPRGRGRHGFHAPLFMEHYQRKQGMAIKSSIQPIPPSMDSVAPAAQRKNWIMELVVRLIMPLLKSRWGVFLLYKNEVDKAIEAAEEVAEVVEKVAEEVEMTAEELVEELPDGNIKNTMRFIENVAHQAAKEAQLADATILKVEEFEDEVDGYIDPSLSKAGKTGKEENHKHQQAFEHKKMRTEASHKNEEPFDREHNHFDILGGLFPIHFDILDCLVYHFTSLFR